MPRIQFPDVPIYPGVPDVNRIPQSVAILTGIDQRLAAFDIFGIRKRFSKVEWAIYSAAGAAATGDPVASGKFAIEPDSFFDLNYSTTQKVATHPLEKGGFTSYNKVANPSQIKIGMTCDGKGKMTREAFLARLEALKNGYELLDILTPDVVYRNYNVESFDYKRSNDEGGYTLIHAEVNLVEIRNTTVKNQVVAKDINGAATVSNGTVMARPLTDKQVAAIAQGLFKP